MGTVLIEHDYDFKLKLKCSDFNIHWLITWAKLLLALGSMYVI